MNIIFVSNKMSKAKTLSIWQVALIGLSLVCLPVLLTLVLILPQDASTQQGVKSLLPANLSFFNNTQKHLDAYAIMLGELQARMTRLDAQTERLSKLTGEKKATNAPNSTPTLPNSPTSNTDAALPKFAKPNTGGPLVLSSPKTELQLKQDIDDLLAQIEARTETLDDLEARLLQQSVYKDMLPNSSPVTAAYNSSSYGWRIDPFTGHRAFHEGLDFSADIGTPIRAAADGVVNFAEAYAGYGNIVKIDHGSGLETRYAHASKIFVKAGQRVSKGQVVALVGSTGRSTGAHLHYEIRLDGIALDPRKYLKNNG